MNKYILAIILLSTFIMTGCASPPPPIVEVAVRPVERIKLELPPVDLIEMEKINWYVITKDSMNETFHRLEKEGHDPVLFALSDQGYINLSLNFANTRKLIQQQQAIMRAYHFYYVDQDRAIEEQQNMFVEKFDELKTILIE